MSKHNGTAITIDKGVPIPRRAYGHSKTLKYPWPEMDACDSIFVPGKTVSPAHAARQWAERHAPERKFTARKERDGIRIWRTA